MDGQWHADRGGTPGTVTANPSILRRADETGVPLLIVRLVLGVLFIYMGVQKVGHPVEFLKQIRLYEMLPESPGIFLNGTALVLPWMEILCGTALILGLWVRGAAGLIGLMLGVFTPAILMRTLAIRAEEGTPFLQIAFDCGCGAGEVVAWTKMLTNTGLLALALTGLVSRSRRFCLSLWFERRRPDPSFCHLCGYAVQETRVGLCERCAQPPARPSADREAA